MCRKYTHFELAEFVASDTARLRRIDNTPTFAAVDNLDVLVMTILEPLRAAWGSGLKVTSGYRCRALNTAVGGVANSVHMLGYAADIVPANGQTEAFMEFAEDWLRRTGTPFDQSIRERDRRGNTWWHIGLYSNAGTQRRQYLALTKQ